MQGLPADNVRDVSGTALLWPVTVYVPLRLSADKKQDQGI